MSTLALRAHGSKKKRGDWDLVRAKKYLAGELSLGEALKIDATLIGDLRARAFALYETKRWQKAIDVLHALGALGAFEPWDPVMLSRAYDEIGDGERAAIWAEVAQEVLADLDVAVRGLARSAT